MKSIRDIYKIGKGPSSSHTIGPERAANHFRQLYPQADRFQVELYGSLSKTGKGHGTDRVLREVLSPLPTRIIFRKDMPADVRHPNTMDFSAIQNGEVYDTLRVESIGGGDIHYAGQSAAELEEIYRQKLAQEAAEPSEDVVEEAEQILYEEEEELTYSIVGSTEADSLHGKISNESPVGKKLIGARVGDTVEVETPSAVLKFKVLSIERSI